MHSHSNLLDIHQLKAIDQLETGKILCADPGAGKTRTALGYFFTKHKGKDLFVITTAKTRDEAKWEKEALAFDPEMQTPITVDSWNNISKYIHIQDAFFVFDEQRTVGSGKWSKCFLKIASKNDWIMLSATPGDKWEDYVTVFIANGYFRNRSQFNREHVIYNPYMKIPVPKGYLNTFKLMKMRDSILVKMTVPRETIRTDIPIVNSYNRDLYKLTVRRRWNPFTDEPIQNASGLCQVLRKIANSDESRLKQTYYLAESHKKCVIFYNFNYELDLLKDLFADTDFVVTEWNGKKHQLIPPGEKWIYLVQYTAGAEGWDCTETNTIIFYSQHYSYKILEQAEGRIDRRTTPFKELYYYHMTSDAPIDKAIAHCIRNKKIFVESKFAQM